MAANSNRNPFSLADQYKVEVNSTKFKEKVFDRMLDQLTTRQKVRLIRIIEGIERCVKVKESPESTSTEESGTSAPTSAAGGNDDKSVPKPTVASSVPSHSSIPMVSKPGSSSVPSSSLPDMNRKLPKPERKTFAELVFRVIGQQLTKLSDVQINNKCEDILQALDIDPAKYINFGYLDPLI